MPGDIEKTMKMPGTAVCRLPGSKPCWKIFHHPIKTITCYGLKEVFSCLATVEAEQRKGRYVVGFISYEAAAAFDQAYPVRESRFPLLWFGVYTGTPPVYAVRHEDCSIATVINQPIPEVSEDDYFAAIRDIKSQLRDGNVYQVNFTFRNRCRKPTSPARLFNTLFLRHPMPYAAFVNTGDYQLISLSPELFLEKRGKNIRSSPMKGTSSRNADPVQDQRQATFLQRDSKNMAENLMIVDMVRNDLGRICLSGSVRVDPIFEVQTYQTLHQMVSTVHGELMSDVGISNILEATFPAASITGAPKIAAMRHIQRLESSPRRVYTGAIGGFVPNGDFCLNVAIRTLICGEGITELGVGGGIVADSRPAEEWVEALLKTKFVAGITAPPGMQILETMLWRRGRGMLYLREHLRRAAQSQRGLGGIWEKVRVLATISDAEKRLQKYDFARVRLLINYDGNAKIEIFPLRQPGWNKSTLRVKIADLSTNSHDVWLRYKTTHREFYDYQFKLALDEGFDEVIFFNERGELTEGAISNLFLKIDNNWYTAPVKCGLLPGIWRARMMQKLMASEKVLYRDDLSLADEILLGNAVRRGCVGKVFSSS